MFAGLCTISTNMWLRVSIDTRDHSNTSDRPPACSASATTVPTNAFTSFGRRTTMPVTNGASPGLPALTKYSSVRYGKSSTRGDAATTFTGGFGYIGPGPVTAGEIDGSDSGVWPQADGGETMPSAPGSIAITSASSTF